MRNQRPNASQETQRLAPYRVVISSSHPEYISTAIFDATEEHVRRGGRMMYLGGNGWYWRIGYHPTRSGIVEVRRPDAPRLWAADVSQGHLSFSGERAGTWSWAGRPPHTFLGVGFITQGLTSAPTTGAPRPLTTSGPPSFSMVWTANSSATSVC